MNLTIFFTSEPEGGYTAEILELPGCVSYGETLEEAKEMIKDAAIGYITSLKKHGEYVPIIKKESFISLLSLHETI
ncbi:type II toxin-antitoxin system HicB family antitoxin [Candidatus Gracilibacteria bacterium]|nr:type II toxin-antitoxin system HicB family antitoxin [Candidatus Gracilibacteria bacterium]